MNTIIGRRIVILEEVKKMDDHTFSKFRDMITSTHIEHRAMYSEMKNVGHYALYFIYANQDDPISQIDVNERRFPLFNVNPQYVGDKEYFKRLFQWKDTHWYFINNSFSKRTGTSILTTTSNYLSCPISSGMLSISIGHTTLTRRHSTER